MPTRITSDEAWVLFLKEHIGNFKRIPGYENYAINDQGTEVWTFWNKASRQYALTNRSGHISKGGYKGIGLYKEGKVHVIKIHQLVCLTFKGPAPSPKHIVRHLNNNKLDNRIENLEWGTQADNAADSPRIGWKRPPISRKFTLCNYEQAFLLFQQEFGSNFRIIPNYPHYVVSNIGEVYRFWSEKRKGYSPRKIKWQIVSKRPVVSFSRRKKCTVDMKGVGRVVAWTFIGPPPNPDFVARHKNDDPFDNRVENIEWGSKRDNTIDAIRNNKNSFVTQNSRLRISDDQIREIRNLRALGISRKELAERFNLRKNRITAICLGKVRTTVEGPITRVGKQPLTLQQRNEIRSLRKNNISREEISVKFNISKQHVTDICRRKFKGE